MLRFTRPSDFARSLRETYEYLLGSLVSLMGYPLSIEESNVENGVNEERVSMDNGGMKFLLPTLPKEGRPLYLLLTSQAMADPYCRKLVNRFVRLCASFLEEHKRSWDLKAMLVKKEQFLWDNLVVSLTHSENQEYNVLDILACIRESLLFRYEGNHQRQASW